MSKENPAEQHGGWQPTPQGGDYDGEATAFVHLSPEDLADIPLAAPGHGYTPPMILPLTPAAGLDPAATGNWVVQTPEQQREQQPEQQTGQPEHSVPSAPPAPSVPSAPSAPDEVHWPDPNQQSGYGYPHPGTQPYQDPYAGDPAATGQWSTDTTATWPAAAAPLSDDSGELYTAPPVTDWYADRPATLPGGAAAPWTVTEPAPEPPAEADAGAEAPAGVPAESAPEPVRHDDEQPAPAGAGSDAEAPRTEAAEPAAESPEDAEPVAESPEDAEPVAETGEAAAPGTEGPEASDAPLAVIPAGPSEHPAASYVLHVNGVDRPVTDAWIGESLLYVLRERLGLAGAKDGCSQGECGACNVQVDGRLVASCLVPAATTAGSEVRTVEGLAVDGNRPTCSGRWRTAVPSSAASASPAWR